MEKSVGKDENYRFHKREVEVKEKLEDREKLFDQFWLSNRPIQPYRFETGSHSQRHVHWDQSVLLGIKVSSETHDQILARFSLRTDNYAAHSGRAL